MEILQYYQLKAILCMEIYCVVHNQQKLRKQKIVQSSFQCQYSTCTLHFLSKRTSYDAMADLSITRFLDLNIYKQSEKRTYFVCLHHANSVNSMSEQSSQGSLKNIDETVIKLNTNVIVAPTAFSVGEINSVDPNLAYCIYVKQ